jgi:ABC-type multidrug transport system fused ATPase/permease subunit
MPKKRKSKSSQSSPSLIADLRRLYYHLSRRRRWQLGALLALMVVTSLAEMVSVGAIFPFLLALGNEEGLLQQARWQPLFELLQIDTTQRLVWAMALGFIGAVGVSNGLRLLTLRSQNRLAAAVGADISSQVYHTTLYQPYSFHVRQNSSDLIQVVSGDTGRLTGILLELLNFLTNLLLAPALIATLLVINWQVAVGSALILGVTYTLIFRIRDRQLRHNSGVISRAGQQKVKLVQEGLGGIRDVLLDHSQGFFDRAYGRIERRLIQANAMNAIIAASPLYVIEFIAMAAIALLALGLGRGGDFSQAVPVLGSLALGARRLVPAVQGLFASAANIQGSRASLLRVLIALNRPIDPLMQLPVPPPVGLGREIRLQKVWFRYGQDSDWVLRDLDLTIGAKTTVALVGSTGSGKSTTADLILGLLPPQQGQILVDGVALTGERLRQWQAAVAHVPQQIYLSDSSLAENIAFGIPEGEIDRAQVRRAAKLAQIDGFIEGLPAGYDTYVGERGIRLSGGQRQRIGIARALYKKASVIVFDEATSALDNATEREVMGAIESLGGQFTIILIAHRLSTVERCDLVVELERGRVVAQGSYGELMARSASFQRMAGVG